MRSAWYIAAMAIVGGCSATVCGPGQKRVQQPSGSVVCMAADSAVICDDDAGATIVGGKCVSQIQCGPSTRLDPVSHLCIGTGSSDGGVAPTCLPPATGKICVAGVVHHLLDDSFLGSGETVHIALYDPLAFLTVDNPPALAESDSSGTFLFSEVTPPGTGLLALVVRDASGSVLPPLQLTGTGAKVVAGQSYLVDGYATPKSLVADWSHAAGFDFDSSGAYMMKFYSDLPASVTDFSASEKNPVTEVVPVVNGAAVGSSSVYYFGASLAVLDNALHATGASGTALLPRNDALIANYSGQGGTFMSKMLAWETHPGGTIAHGLFVERLHRCPEAGCM